MVRPRFPDGRFSWNRLGLPDQRLEPGLQILRRCGVKAVVDLARIDQLFALLPGELKAPSHLLPSSANPAMASVSRMAQVFFTQSLMRPETYRHRRPMAFEGTRRPAGAAKGRSGATPRSSGARCASRAGPYGSHAINQPQNYPAHCQRMTPHK